MQEMLDEYRLRDESRVKDHFYDLARSFLSAAALRADADLVSHGLL